MYLYEMEPIDIWTGWVKFEDVLQDPYRYHYTSFSSRHPNSTDQDVAAKQLIQLVDGVKKQLSEYTEWEGDGEVYLTSMPYELEARLVFAIKQNNNGTTYIAAPFEYIHLKDFLVKIT